MESAQLVLGAAFGSFPAMDIWVKVRLFVQGGWSYRATQNLHGGHIGFQNGLHQTLYFKIHILPHPHNRHDLRY